MSRGVRLLELRGEWDWWGCTVAALQPLLPQPMLSEIFNLFQNPVSTELCPFVFLYQRITKSNTCPHPNNLTRQAHNTILKSWAKKVFVIFFACPFVLVIEESPDNTG